MPASGFVADTSRSQFTSFFRGAGDRAAGGTLARPGVRQHLHRVIGVRAEPVQHRAQRMADLRLPARLLLQDGAGCLVQQLVALHDPVNFVGRRRFPGHLDVLAGQRRAGHVLRRGAWNCVKSYRKSEGTAPPFALENRGFQFREGGDRQPSQRGELAANEDVD